MNVEEDYLDVLQNIEAAVGEIANADASLTDYDVEKVYSILIMHYSAEAANKRSATASINADTLRLFALVKEMCEWRLGRQTSQTLPTVEPIGLDVMVACLKRLRKSVQHWTKEGGRHGYLTFIANFV